MNKKKKLKIAIISSTYLPSIGGSQIGIHNICLGLIKLGHEPIIIIPYGCYRKLKKQKWSLSYKIIPLPPKILRLYFFLPDIFIYFIKNYLKFLNLYFNFDFWIANMAYPSGVVLSRTFPKLKNNFTSVLCPGEDIQIDYEINYGLRIDKKINNQVTKYLPNINNFIALTESVKLEFSKLGINSKIIHEIPYGVNSDDLLIKEDKIILRTKHNIDKKKFIFLCVGRNHPKKNFQLLNKIVSHLKNKNLNQKFQIIVIGKDSSLLQDDIIKSENEKYFLLREEIGSLDKKNPKFPSTLLSEYYNLSDCFLFPSNLETFGIVLVEAMMTGLPVITTNAPGCKDVVRNLTDGLVFDKNDYKSAANLMQTLINNKNNSMEDYKIKSIQRSSNFSILSIAKMYENLILKTNK